MTTSTKPREVLPQTLSEAHVYASKLRPAPDADLPTLRDFHQRNARMYTEIADLDRAHHHEALYWVGYEQRKTAELTHQITKPTI